LLRQWLTTPPLHRNALRTAKKWLKTKRKDMNEQQELQKKIIPNKFCIHCVHKKRALLKHGAQIYCEMQPSAQSNSGYKTIKAHDYACGLYEQRL
jgi:hypothetical protein